ncbi:MAG: chaperone modulator CbpM [Gammaproteobacteria bacterium]|nr:chaperone modulator CbpM [Gammaproteobacteria bacterium]
MTHESVSVVTGILLDEDTELALDDLARACGAEREWVLELIAEGIISPADKSGREWRFRGSSLTRVRVARRLQRDLEVNVSGIALALDLLDEIERLRARLRQYDDRP